MATGMALTATGCSAVTGGPSAQEVVDNYAEGVHATYADSLESAQAMDVAIDDFLAEPSPRGFSAAKEAWLSARDDYGKTEVYRFYGGPIDNEETGNEGLINAWPLDEGYIDYVEGDANTGVVNSANEYPEITTELLTELNEQDGEANISTGWHAIEFLLWGQDLSEDGPGMRLFTDYADAPNAERRSEYLSLTSDLLITHLTELVDAWAPDGENYRTEFVSDADEALRRMTTGIGEMSRGELAGERMSVAFLERSQEDEHSCFSDNTNADIIANALGIQMVVTGDFTEDVSGPGLADLVATEDEELANQMRDQVAQSIELARSIPGPFDQHLQSGVADDDPGRVAIEETMTSLENQTDTIVAGANALGVTVNVS